MAVHMIRVCCEPPKGEAESAIENWVDNYTEWEKDPVTHELVVTTAGIDGTEYVRGDWRFIQEGEDPTDILKDLSERLQSIQDGLWHRLGYHVCTHDGTGGPCSWDDSVEFGDVPADIPTF